MVRYAYRIFRDYPYSDKKDTHYIPREFKSLKDARYDANTFVRLRGFHDLGKSTTKGTVWAEIYRLPLTPGKKAVPTQYVFYDPRNGKCYVGGKTGKGFMRNRYINPNGTLGETM